MQRYFLEVAYNGARYAGFQRQENSDTIQSEVERAMEVYYRKPFSLTGSSRTDAGVHAFQNYFHFDGDGEGLMRPDAAVYHLNAILPHDIVIRRMIPVGAEAHCRFDAIARSYRYMVYRQKDPFLYQRAYYFPYQLNIELMQEAAAEVMLYTSFEAFSKKNTQVHTYECAISQSVWREEPGMLYYEVTANRFLRGMVRGLTATMLKVGRGKMSLEEFRSILRARVHASAAFDVPAHGLYLVRVLYPSAGGGENNC